MKTVTLKRFLLTILNTYNAAWIFIWLPVHEPTKWILYAERALILVSIALNWDILLRGGD